MDRCIERLDTIYDMFENKWKIVRIVREEYLLAECNEFNPCEDVTNGDMIKMLFPQIKTKELRDAEVLCIHNTLSGSCDLSWWNAPYKSEKEVS